MHCHKYAIRHWAHILPLYRVFKPLDGREVSEGMGREGGIEVWCEGVGYVLISQGTPESKYLGGLLPCRLWCYKISVKGLWSSDFFFPFCMKHLKTAEVLNVIEHSWLYGNRDGQIDYKVHWHTWIYTEMFIIQFVKVLKCASSPSVAPYTPQLFWHITNDKCEVLFWFVHKISYL